MYNLNRLRETFLVLTTTQDDVQDKINKIKAQYHYPHYTITIFKQCDTETIVQVWEVYRFNE
jgi:hypothetical protein